VGAVMTNKIDPTTFKPGDIVHVRGKVDEIYTDLTSIELTSDGGYNWSVSTDSVVAHFPAIRSWSEIEGRLNKTFGEYGILTNRNAIIQSVIALLNEIDPKGDV